MVQLAAWEQPVQPQALRDPAFHLWRDSITRHRRNIEAARGRVDLEQYQREVSELNKVSCGHQRTRRFKQKEEQAVLQRNNARLVQRLFDVAKQSERRQIQIVESAARCDSELSTLNETVRRQAHSAITVENAALLKRLHTAKSVIPSAASTALDYHRHAECSARISRLRRTTNPAPRPPLSSRRQKVDKPCSLVNQSSELVQLPPIPSRTSRRVLGPAANAVEAVPSPIASRLANMVQPPGRTNLALGNTDLIVEHSSCSNATVPQPPASTSLRVSSPLVLGARVPTFNANGHDPPGIPAEEELQGKSCEDTETESGMAGSVAGHNASEGAPSSTEFFASDFEEEEADEEEDDFDEG